MSGNESVHQYAEEQRSAADKGIGSNANWNKLGDQAGTTITAQGIWPITCLVTLPMISFPSAFLPWEPMMMRSIFSFAAVLTIAL
ncbi:MAG: hypothetical protein A2521_07950 [Deltaproteobacteria bacterium RIFOXYD12_FULL_57_12]|nr:MAG: hypothetical protein A2521_07950 [Deltaproteobacteria bacterium RIFOXYD12_FULL_57_12]